MRVVKTLKEISMMVLISLCLGLTSFQPLFAGHNQADAIWRCLQSGNKKFVNDPRYVRQREKLKSSQNPNCVVLSCSDSRVPPEVVFNQLDLGKLFVIRVAGEVADDVVVDSIEFAVGHYDVSLIVVMGHTNCGAVEGAIEHLIENNGQVDPTNGHINAVLIPIEMAIVQAGIDIYAPNAVELSVRANIAYVANQLLSQSPEIAAAVADGTVKIIGTEYNLKTGKIKKLFVIGG